MKVIIYKLTDTIIIKELRALFPYRVSNAGDGNKCWYFGK